MKLRLLKYFFGQVGGVGWEDELKNKTNLSQRLVEVEAELGKKVKDYHTILHKHLLHTYRLLDKLFLAKFGPHFV